MRYRYGLYAMIVLSVAAATLLFDDLDRGLTVINLIVWPLVIIGAIVIALRKPHHRLDRASRRRRTATGRVHALRAASRHPLDHAKAPPLIEYRNGSV